MREGEQNLPIAESEKHSKILLHSCCAPCSAAIIESLLKDGIRPTVFYCNPNIFPREEYEHRKAENIRYVKSLDLDFVDADIDRQKWLEVICGLENEPERGLRCLECFKFRLLKTAEYANRNGFRVFTTSLASSRWKDLNQIFEAGEFAASAYPNTLFWSKNWRKGGLSERRKKLVQEHGFYRQNYCGCEFSIRKRKE